MPFRFTGFLSGTYMLSDETKMLYQGPGHSAGKSSINWNTAADLPTEIADLNQAYQAGNEIGSHFNGHFCEGADPSGNAWTTDDWNNELDQFFSLIKNVKANNPNVTMPDLVFDGSVVKGERTPCLEGHAEDLFPALTAHNMTYDSSFTKTGISWPTQSPQYKIWQFGMATFPINGTGKQQITMDYNFYYTQRQASSTGVTQEQSDADAAQVQGDLRRHVQRHLQRQPRTAGAGQPLQRVEQQRLRERADQLRAGEVRAARGAVRAVPGRVGLDGRAGSGAARAAAGPAAGDRFRRLIGAHRVSRRRQPPT